MTIQACVREGVETEKAFSFLKERGCHRFQGYLFSKPLPAAEMAEKLKQRKYMNRDNVLQTTDQPTDKKAKASA